MPVHRAAETGNEPGDGEALQLDGRRAHGEGASGIFIVADSNQSTADAAAAHVARQPQRQQKRGQSDVVVRTARVDGVAEEHWPARLHASAERQILGKDVRRHDQREPECRDSDQQTLDPQ